MSGMRGRGPMLTLAILITVREWHIPPHMKSCKKQNGQLTPDLCLLNLLNLTTSGADWPACGQRGCPLLRQRDPSGRHRLLQISWRGRTFLPVASRIDKVAGPACLCMPLSMLSLFPVNLDNFRSLCCRQSTSWIAIRMVRTRTHTHAHTRVEFPPCFF
jgi:hypothetical protein